MRKLKKYVPTKFMAKDSQYDKAAADYAVNFIECLCHTKGTWAGKPFELIDWQEQIIRDVFGVLKPNGYRQFNTAYIEIPKKQGKSELAAAVALLLTCGDFEERAEVYGCAADRQQASIVFEVAADMVRMCPALNRRVKILAATKRIIYMPTNSFYQVLSAEAYSKHGFNIHGVVFDELHTQPNRKLFDVMTKGSGDARMQPLYFLITTAGTDTHSICYETHQKAKDIIAGRKYDTTFYPVIYGADENDDWTDPKVWKKANPSLGITVGLDKVQAACASAKQNPAEENSFRQLRLNQWVKQAVRWMPMDKWEKCKTEIDEDELEGRVCYGGLDLSSTSDITAFVLVFPPTDEDDRYIVLPYFWIASAIQSSRSLVASIVREVMGTFGCFTYPLFTNVRITSVRISGASSNLVASREQSIWKNTSFTPPALLRITSFVQVCWWNSCSNLNSVNVASSFTIRKVSAIQYSASRCTPTFSSQASSCSATALQGPAFFIH